MRRVIVLGAGLFGRTIAERLTAVGVPALLASRHGPDLRLDAEDEGSLRATLGAGDVVVDTAGPWPARTTRLAMVAMRLGCDVVDLSESLAWCDRILALAERIASSATRYYPACSAVAAVAAECMRESGMATPLEVDLFLAPASAETASPGAVRGFTGSLGLPVRTLRDGELVVVRGYRDHCAFPGSRRRGGLVESAASVLLPRSWSSLRRAELWVDPNAPLARRALSLAARVAPIAALVRAIAPRIGSAGIGRRDGTFAVSVRDETRTASYVFSSPRRSYLIAVEPAVIVAEALARGASPASGIVLPHAQVEPHVLFPRLAGLGIDIAEM
jgi:hypothetical protein